MTARQRATARLITLAALAVLAGLLAGCGNALSISSDGSSQSITLYSGQHPQTTDRIVAAFEQKTGITVQVRSDDEDVLADQIVTEGRHSPADVIYTENSPALEFLQSRGLLSAVDPATLTAVPARFNSPQGRWAGVSARVSVIVYNPSLISAGQLPRSVMQLADPKYQGKLALAAGETDFQPIVTAVLRAHGHAATIRWLNGIKANAAGHIYPDNETITSQVNRGAAALGIINQYYWYRLRAETGASNMHSAIAYFAPHDPGYVIDVSGAAVLKSSPHQAAAQRFLAFLVSKAGPGDPRPDSLSFEYPIASGVTRGGAETPLSALRPTRSIAALGDGSAAVALLRQAQLL